MRRDAGHLECRRATRGAARPGAAEGPGWESEVGEPDYRPVNLRYQALQDVDMRFIPLNIPVSSSSCLGGDTSCV